MENRNEFLVNCRAPIVIQFYQEDYFMMSMCVHRSNHKRNGSFGTNTQKLNNTNRWVFVDVSPLQVPVHLSNIYTTGVSKIGSREKIGIFLPSLSLRKLFACLRYMWRNLFLKSNKHDTNNKTLNDVLKVNAHATLLLFVPILAAWTTNTHRLHGMSFFIRLYFRTAKYFKPLSPT